MFRNPRTKADLAAGSYVAPSVGRPPSPSDTKSPHFTKNQDSPLNNPTNPTQPPPPTMATRTMPPRSSSGNKQAKTPTTARGSTNAKKTATSSNAKKTATSSNAKPKGKPNGSILSFFKKDDGLFVADPVPSTKSGDEVVHDVVAVDEEESRFNEDGGAVKRRKLSPVQDDGPSQLSPDPPEAVEKKNPMVRKNSSPVGPFVEESDSEHDDDDDDDDVNAVTPAAPVKEEAIGGTTPPPSPPQDQSNIKPEEPEKKQRPPLIHQPTSASVADLDNFDAFEATDDFEDDVFDEGEEYVARLWAEEEQRLLELDDAQDDSFQDESDKIEEAEAASCPICTIKMDGISESDAAVHVNNCLDGNPTPLPEKKVTAPAAPTALSPAPFKRPPKPGQSQPATSNSGPSASAFAKLMTGRSEDLAWANAAAAEQKSRGKPSYERTCPFYKILPGTNICVDAFRYGAVEGCKAYFLSHFHSDHYIGLSSTWSHGPIYCSKVTANLVRQQLRVDPQYVIPLDWEEKTEVPGTPNVTVTMISANHCPGSSLFLFEKPLSKGPDPKLHRVLHCGDFRACKMHLQHPLLRPDVQDHMTGKSKEQKIDVCYLDTTYLNPKYAFPEQEDVIKACSTLCVNLNSSSEAFESISRGGSSGKIKNFVMKENQATLETSVSSTIKHEEEDSNDIKLHPNGKLTSTKSSRLLVVVGTYSIGKERICIGIAHALKSKIYAPPAKQRICSALEDPELSSLLTTDPREAQVHMTPIFEIRADTLDEYRVLYADTFDRCVGFRPSGWNYKPPVSRDQSAPSVNSILYSGSWRENYGVKDMQPQRGSSKKAACYGVPYSEHSSFRELTMFCTGLRIEKVVPTVNVGSGKGRERMKVWADRWIAERKRGLFEVKDW